MSTRNIVPRADGEGSVGTAEKHWGSGWMDETNTDAVIPNGNDNKIGASNKKWKEGHFEKLVADDVIAKGPVVDVRAFGAVGDGEHDDTAAFQAAANTNESLIIKDGTYKITKPVLCNAPVIDNGTYNNLRPVYANEDTIVKRIGNLYRDGAVSFTSEYYGSQQGATYNTKTNKILLALVNGDNSQQKIVTVNPSTLSIETGFNYTELGHANTIEYCPANNKIYVITLNNEIVEIDGDSMQITKTINFTSAFGLKYDIDGGYFVALSGDNPLSIKCYDLDFNLLHESVMNLPSTDTMNGFAVKNGNILLFTWTHYVGFDIFGNLKTFIPVKGGEAEDGYWINDVLYYPTNNTGNNSAIWRVDKYNYHGRYSDELPFRTVNYDNADLNDLKGGECGCYSVSNGTNYPDGKTTGYLVVYDYNGNGTKQVFYERLNGPGNVYVRQFVNGSNSWSDWYMLGGERKILSSEFSDLVGQILKNASCVKGKLVNLNLSMLGVTLTGQTVVGKLPDYIKPVDETQAITYHVDSATTKCELLYTWIRANGEIVIAPDQAYSNINIRIVTSFLML